MELENKGGMGATIDEKAGAHARVPYSRSEGRIMEVLESVCEDAPVQMPKPDRRIRLMKHTLRKACDDMVELFFDELSAAWYNNSAPAEPIIGDVCVDVIGACATREDLMGPLPDDEL